MRVHLLVQYAASTCTDTIKIFEIASSRRKSQSISNMDQISFSSLLKPSAELGSQTRARWGPMRRATWG